MTFNAVHRYYVVFSTPVDETTLVIFKECVSSCPSLSFPELTSAINCLPAGLPAAPCCLILVIIPSSQSAQKAGLRKPDSFRVSSLHHPAHHSPKFRPNYVNTFARARLLLLEAITKLQLSYDVLRCATARSAASTRSPPSLTFRATRTCMRVYLKCTALPATLRPQSLPPLQAQACTGLSPSL